MKNFGLILGFAALLSSCCTVKNSVAEQQNNLRAEWKIVKVNGNKVKGAETPTLCIDGERVYGNTSCNSYTGSYKLEGNKITFGQVGVTRRFCGEENSEQEVLKAINETTFFEVSKNKATLYDANKKSIMELAK